MDPPVFPCELLYLVIDAIDATFPEGRQRLFNCSSANRVLRIICQERIFQSVEISYVGTRSEEAGQVFCDDEETTGQKFLDLLSGSPHIASYVQNLTINTMVLGGRVRSSSETPSFSLYAIVPQLLNLKGYFISRDDRYPWSDLEERTRNFFTTIIPLVTKLDFFCFPSFPVSLFSGCYNLQELHVSTLDINAKEVARPSGYKVKLQLLEVGFAVLKPKPLTPWFNPSHSPLDISKLRSLKLSDIHCSVSHIDDMLALCSSTLEELDFHVDIYGHKHWQVTDLENTPDLSVLHNLRHLTVRTCIRGHLYQRPDIEEQNDLSYIAIMLTTLPFKMLRRNQLQLDLLVKVVRLSNFETSLAHLPWFDFISILDCARVSSYFSNVKVGVKQCDGLSVSDVNMTPAALVEILDKNEGLKKLREKAILSYSHY